MKYTKTNPNHPANPVNEETTDRIIEGITIYSGLSKREQFASMAMQGFISSGVAEEYSKDDIDSLSVGAADALIEALNKEEQ